MNDAVSHYEISPVAILFIVLLVMVVLRRTLRLPRGQLAEALPKAAPVSNRTTRVAEALILICAALAILVFAATNASTGGLLLMLDRLRGGQLLRRRGLQQLLQLRAVLRRAPAVRAVSTGLRAHRWLRPLRPGLHAELLEL